MENLAAAGGRIEVKMSKKLRKGKTKVTSSPRKSMACRIVVLLILVIMFSGTWLNIFLTSSCFNRQLDKMVEGTDYYIEDVKITKKDYDSYYSTPDSSVETTNYFFYYDESFQKKMFVDEDTYKKYSVGDSVKAYTMDHENYGFTKESLLYGTEYRNNELKKCIGVILGVSLIFYFIWMWLTFKST
jgi:hypothetical protein